MKKEAGKAKTSDAAAAVQQPEAKAAAPKAAAPSRPAAAPPEQTPKVADLPEGLRDVAPRKRPADSVAAPAAPPKRTRAPAAPAPSPEEKAKREKERIHFNRQQSLKVPECPFWLEVRYVPNG